MRYLRTMSFEICRGITSWRCVSERASLFLKWMFFPGLDLYTRGRYRFLPRLFLQGSVRTLDAGCGNGALTYAAYCLGNEVLGVTFDASEVEKAHTLFSS